MFIFTASRVADSSSSFRLNDDIFLFPIFSVDKKQSPASKILLEGAQINNESVTNRFFCLHVKVELVQSF